ncbi:xanthine phosphoribosyltransferase [Sporolactobacillus shoreicorticis]|uniref:Xanthine phosphoribosyltransferase n=1 Tax=Sporolactobacillus shoreicorticis TaxID=1923877 RepID=A0ABW5S622_9BACL|nr:xanthine phosphoribosyltransferase [Sporolactobacillus shoreicorticis]MCO7125748.1 xanthine phosphoribosyltransferase [Sporolactobacillus shoreicorticis]
MEELKKRIREDGTVINSDILKVDQFLNHQIDPSLLRNIGEQFAQAFANSDVSKILTIESSGIAPALMTGLALNVPVVFARKKKPLTLNEGSLTTKIQSYTKHLNNSVYLENNMLSAEDHVLIIDDFLANGEASLGLTRLIEMAGASVAGVGIVIEKTFQPGRTRLDHAGYSVYSLARISSLANNQITFLDD